MPHGLWPGSSKLADMCISAWHMHLHACDLQLPAKRRILQQVDLQNPMPGPPVRVGGVHRRVVVRAGIVHRRIPESSLVREVPNQVCAILVVCVCVAVLPADPACSKPARWELRYLISTPVCRVVFSGQVFA